jgi:hypothetical protein
VLSTFFHTERAERGGLKKPQTVMGKGIEAFPRAMEAVSKR